MSSSTDSSSPSSMTTSTQEPTLSLGSGFPSDATTTEPPCIEGVNCEPKDGNIQLIY